MIQLNKAENIVLSNQCGKQHIAAVLWRERKNHSMMSLQFCWLSKPIVIVHKDCDI